MDQVKNLLKDSSGGPMLFIFPHFDDCAFVSSGLLQEARRYGITTLVCVLAEADDQIGLKEFQSYTSLLGVTKAFTLKTRHASTESNISKLIAETNPEFVITFDPGGITGNSHHTLTCLKTYDALRHLSKRPKLLWRIADFEEEKYFGKTQRPLSKEYDKVVKLNLRLKNSLLKVKSILSNKSKMGGVLHKLRIIEWYLLDHQESYYVVDFDRDRLKVNYG